MGTKDAIDVEAKPVVDAAPAAVAATVPTSTRAKFRVTGIRPELDGHAHLHLQAVTNGSPENDTFFKWTPSGELRLSLVDANTAAMFMIGKDYYLDITPAE